MCTRGETALPVLDFSEVVTGDDLLNLCPLGRITALRSGGQDIHRLGQVRVSRCLERGETGCRWFRLRELFEQR